MKLLALDIAGRTGWVLGSPDGTPTISAWRLKGQDADDRAGDLGDQLRCLCMVNPDIEMIAVEQAMSSMAIMSAPAIEQTYELHGAVRAVARCYGIPVRKTPVATIRTHFCGKASAAAPRQRGSAPRSSRQKEADREATKMMVWRRAVQLGYFERGERPDYDKADAVAVFDHAAFTFLKVQRPFAMFAQVGE